MRIFRDICFLSFAFQWSKQSSFLFAEAWKSAKPGQRAARQLAAKAGQPATEPAWELRRQPGHGWRQIGRAGQAARHLLSELGEFLRRRHGAAAHAEHVGEAGERSAFAAAS